MSRSRGLRESLVFSEGPSGCIQKDPLQLLLPTSLSQDGRKIPPPIADQCPLPGTLLMEAKNLKSKLFLFAYLPLLSAIRFLKNVGRL